jgi:hypothetical protein
LLSCSELNRHPFQQILVENQGEGLSSGLLTGSKQNREFMTWRSVRARRRISASQAALCLQLTQKTVDDRVPENLRAAARNISSAPSSSNVRLVLLLEARRL